MCPECSNGSAALLNKEMKKLPATKMQRDEKTTCSYNKKNFIVRPTDLAYGLHQVCERT